MRCQQLYLIHEHGTHTHTHTLKFMSVYYVHGTDIVHIAIMETISLSKMSTVDEYSYFFLVATIVKLGTHIYIQPRLNRL